MLTLLFKDVRMKQMGTFNNGGGFHCECGCVGGGVGGRGGCIQLRQEPKRTVL